MAVINIKGINNSLVFVFNRGSFADYRSYLEEQLTVNTNLFRGSRLIFRGEGLKLLTFEQIAELQQLCLENGMILNNIDPATTTTTKKVPSKDLFLHRSLRSGQKVRSEGSVLVWGNVHESAEIIAAHDIIILGKLEGIAHAGVYGDLSSVVFALCLAPSQIRIGQVISRNPGGLEKPDYPEVAYLEDNTICIKPYNSREMLSRYIKE
ncbi:MAG: hypothetical protein GX550_07955 [Syntrophomonadaceae bacterium]|nr:hypothetical protein [Syntrophomonadaceae bacterium]